MTYKLKKTMGKKLLILLLFISGFAYSQTTVTLQDQCNCEVLSGTAVNAPGATTPSGADTGDIYVNTNTGVIYYWDGTSWELTSSDDQQLQNFIYNSGTNTLSLTIEDGNTVNVDLGALNDTVTTLVDNGDGTFTYTSENGTATTFDAKIASVVDNLDGTYTITDDSGTSVTIDTNNTVTTLVDNGDGSFTYTSEDGTITTFTETLSTLV
ncbi:MAG: hypothetical protein WBN59_06105, partial [Flavobacteriaceae bacterium]